MYTNALNIPKAVNLSENDHKFNFIVESTGALPPVDIVKRAINILKTKINNFSNDLLENTTGNAANMCF